MKPVDYNRSIIEYEYYEGFLEVKGCNGTIGFVTGKIMN